MELIKKIFSCFFFICVSIGYAEEISQGTLENGMRFYIWPDDSGEVTIELVIKKAKELTEFPLDFFFCMVPYFRGWDLLHFSRESSASNEEMFAFSRGMYSLFIPALNFLPFLRAAALEP